MDEYLKLLMKGGSNAIDQSNSKVNSYLGYTPSPYYQSGASLIQNPTFSGIPSMSAAISNGGYQGQSAWDKWISLGQSAIDTKNRETAAMEQYNSILDKNSTTNAWLGGTNTALQGISTIGGLVMSIKNYEMQKDALKKQSELIDEQISASRESRAQRKAELARLNNVRSNTNQMFSNSAVVSRSY